MPLDTSSFPAYLCSLNITRPVTTRAGRMIAGPPAPVLDAALRLGLGPLIFDSARNRGILASIGIPPEITSHVARRLHARSQWRPAWEAVAEPHIAAAEAAAARGEREAAEREIRLSLALLGLAYGGDNYYFYTPLPERRAAMSTRQRLYTLLREATDQRVEYITVAHPRGRTVGVLHLPPGYTAGQRVPALYALHPLGGDKDNFDFVLALFREAGFATFCVDLPAHGDSFDGPRLQPDDEAMGVAALEMLAARSDIDPKRLGVMGASLGAFYALRTAAASSRARVCLAYASGFDIGAGLPDAVPGIQEQIAFAIGAPTLRQAYEMAKPYHLRDVLGNIRCPVHLVHGTQDHICDFSATYEIARRVKSPISVHPFIGADHEVAIPSTPALANPGIEWLRQNL